MYFQMIWFWSFQNVCQTYAQIVSIHRYIHCIPTQKHHKILKATWIVKSLKPRYFTNHLANTKSSNCPEIGLCKLWGDFQLSKPIFLYSVPEISGHIYNSYDHIILASSLYTHSILLLCFILYHVT